MFLSLFFYSALVVISVCKLWIVLDGCLSFFFFFISPLLKKHYCCVQLFSSSRLSGKGESSNTAFGSSKSFGDQSQQTSFMPLAIEKGQSETA